jgi:hypothetical protein
MLMLFFLLLMLLLSLLLLLMLLLLFLLLHSVDVAFVSAYEKSNVKKGKKNLSNQKILRSRRNA